jgi:hypothetical protein
MFKLRTNQISILEPGKTRMTAVVEIANTSNVAAGGGTTKKRALLIGDNSGSMERRIQALRDAMCAWVNGLDDGTEFAVLTGSAGVRQVYPAYGAGRPRVAVATEQTRREAILAIARIEKDGDTIMSAWVNELAAIAGTGSGYICHALFLTDGENNKDDYANLQTSVRKARGSFVCDARIIGDGASVNFMRNEVATPLLGQCEVIVAPKDMAANFRELVRQVMGKASNDVELVIQCPFPTTRVALVTETQPAKLDLTGTLDPSDPNKRTWVFRTAPWTPGESRRYRVVVEAAPLPNMDAQKGAEFLKKLTEEGRELPQAAIPTVRWNENGTTQSAAGETIKMIFTGNAEKTSLWMAQNRDGVMTVAAETGQVELVEARQELAEARRNGNEDDVTRAAKKVMAVAEDTARTTGDSELVKDEVTRIARAGVTIKDDRDADGTRRVVVHRVEKQDLDVFDAGTTQTRRFSSAPKQVS